MPNLLRLPTARVAGTLCFWGALVSAAWAVINTVWPNSTGMTITGDFYVVNSLMHRIEHALVALVGYPALFLGLFAFVAVGAAGRGWFPRGVLVLAGVAALLMSASSLFEAVVLQSPLADQVRAMGGLVLLFLAPIALAVSALVARAAELPVRLWPLGLALLLVVGSLLGGRLGRWETLYAAVLMLSWAVFGRGVARIAPAVPTAPSPAGGRVAAASR